MTGTAARRSNQNRRRLLQLVAAGLVDSFCLSFAWTVVLLELTRQHGLVAAGLCSTAMLVGVALSAPVATWMSQRLDGRRLLRSAGGVEALLRAGVMAMLAGGAPMWMLAASVTLMNVVAWTGYAGMRAEVAAVSDGAGGITWYGTVVAAVEAVGVAAGALVPLGSGDRPSPEVLAGVGVLYVGALVPTIVVAGGSRVPRAALTGRRPASRWLRRSGSRLRSPSTTTILGALLMAVASAPTLLAVALAAELHGRGSVGLSAAAFTVGSLFAPAVAQYVERTHRNVLRWWLVLAVGMVLGWTTAAQAVIWLCVAQILSGLCMTTLEGLLDTRASRDRPDAVTAALASATAARALGSSVGTAVLPMLVAGAGLSGTALTLTAVLVAATVATTVARAPRPADVVVAPPRSPSVTAPACRTGTAGAAAGASEAAAVS
ncbi:MAG TPA: hypothetical protein VER39_04790 [Nocardioidaceae bacterium]|nr:hypothetical protein [Nocardioidaceae bacterium]